MNIFVFLKFADFCRFLPIFADVLPRYPETMFPGPCRFPRCADICNFGSYIHLAVLQMRSMVYPWIFDKDMSNLLNSPLYVPCARYKWAHSIDTSVMTYPLYLTYDKCFLMFGHDHRGSMVLLYNSSCILHFCFNSLGSIMPWL